jgi:hypothetical protein
MFKPISQKYYYDSEIKICTSKLSNLEKEFFDIEQKILQINTQECMSDITLSNIVVISLLQLQELKKTKHDINIEILKEKRKILDFQIKKIDYEKYVDSFVVQNTQIIVVRPKYV